MKIEMNESVYRCVPLPIGYKVSGCPYCGSIHLSGALVTEYADEQDPDIVCNRCGKLIDRPMY